jgi:hypothetical protein
MKEPCMRQLLAALERSSRSTPTPPPPTLYGMTSRTNSTFTTELLTDARQPGGKKGNSVPLVTIHLHKTHIHYLLDLLVTQQDGLGQFLYAMLARRLSDHLLSPSASASDTQPQTPPDSPAE